MKVAKVLRDIHRNSFPLYEKLGKRVEDTLKHKVESRGWQFVSRIKDEQSFAQKVETCTVNDPSKLEDFFACTIVVLTADDFREAERIVDAEYEIEERRPETDINTDKNSFDFYFDDLRLYVHKRPSITSRPTKLDGVRFEIQIKTVFQQAWGLATHDYVYKSGTASWARERIAYQIRAILEQADVMLMLSKRSGINTFPTLAKRHKRTAKITTLINFIDEVWAEEQIPNDKLRLAKTIYILLNRVNCMDKFRDVINGEIDRVGGSVPINLSPYFFVVQALLNTQLIDFKKCFERYYSKKRDENMICVHSDMDIPGWVKNVEFGVQYLEDRLVESLIREYPDQC